MSLLQYVTLPFTIQSILMGQNKVLVKNTFIKMYLKYICVYAKYTTNTFIYLCT